VRLLLSRQQESAPKGDAELGRYRKAGASAVARYCFAEQSMDAFFTTAFMGNYSEAVFVEGDCPIDFVDLSVFVAPAPAKGRSLLRRVAGSAPRPDFHGFHAVPGELDALVRLLGGGGPPKQQRARGARGAAKSKGSGVLAFPGPAPAEHWAVEERYAGIERAQLVVLQLYEKSFGRTRPEVVVSIEDRARQQTAAKAKKKAQKAKRRAAALEAAALEAAALDAAALDAAALEAPALDAAAQGATTNESE